MSTLPNRLFLPRWWKILALSTERRVPATRHVPTRDEGPSRRRIIVEALRSGDSLQVVEDYFDWLDMIPARN